MVKSPQKIDIFPKFLATDSCYQYLYKKKEKFMITYWYSIDE